MSEVFVVRNQLGQYWGKKKRWVDGTKPRVVAHFKHEDEGINQLVELSAKDMELRGEVVPAELDERGVPVVEPSEHLIPDEEEPLAEAAADEAEAEKSVEATEGAANGSDAENPEVDNPAEETPANP